MSAQETLLVREPTCENCVDLSVILRDDQAQRVNGERANAIGPCPYCGRIVYEPRPGECLGVDNVAKWPKDLTKYLSRSPTTGAMVLAFWILHARR